MDFIVKRPRGAWVVELGGHPIFQSERQVDALALALNAALERWASEGREHRVIMERSGGARIEIAAFGRTLVPANEPSLPQAA